MTIDTLQHLPLWQTESSSASDANFEGCKLRCKHLVRKANEILEDTPLNDLSFFFNLCRKRYPPYYKMPGIHYKKDMEGSEEEVEIQVVGDNLRGETRSHDLETVKQPTQIPPTGPSLPATQVMVNLLPSAPANSERQAVENTEEQNEDQEGGDDGEEYDDSDNDGDGKAVERVSVVM